MRLVYDVGGPVSQRLFDGGNAHDFHVCAQMDCHTIVSRSETRSFEI
jgi:hypothetical protein